MKANYHAHTSRCKHATGEDEAYVLAAMEAGFDVLGFSDHAPWPFQNGYVSRIRMDMEQFPDYVRSVQDLRARFADRITVHLGLEAEYFPRYHDHLLRMRENGAEYFILGQHYADSEEDNPYVGRECQTDDGVLRYADSVVKGMRTGLFSYVCHPDLYMRLRTDDEFGPACMEAADRICQCALEMRMPLEYNLLGLYESMQGEPCGYPSKAFWTYARKYNNAVILGVDAHHPLHLKNEEVRAAALRHLQSLNYTLIDHLPMDD